MIRIPTGHDGRAELSEHDISYSVATVDVSSVSGSGHGLVIRSTEYSIMHVDVGVEAGVRALLLIYSTESTKSTEWSRGCQYTSVISHDSWLIE